MRHPDLNLNDLTDQTIFLSYRSRDEAEVNGLAVLLENLGNTVIRMSNFPAGRWADHIYDSLAGADALLIYLSRAPDRTILRKLTSGLGRGVTSAFRYLTRRPSEPADWMREEFEHFTKVHGTSRKIIIYAEEDAEQPSHLQDQQMHFYVSQLTELRKKWQQLMTDKVSKKDARRIIVEELKAQGINLGQAEGGAVVDMFGVHGMRSGLRYVWHHAKGPLAFAPLALVVALMMGSSYAMARAVTADRISVPITSQVDIRINESGRTACAAIDMVCVSVSQITAYYGQVDDKDFYGYATPTCESRVSASRTCPSTFRTDYEMSGVYYQRSINTERSDVNLGRSRFCLERPVYQSANCVSPLGE